MGKTKIEWADVSWNVATGCTKVSTGCKFCYAETIANRFWGNRKFTDVRTHPERLDDPAHWKKPRMVFVDSMSDLFHPEIPFEFIDKVFDQMERYDQHTYMILTKRPWTMLDYLRIHNRTSRPNIWLGVSIEDQLTANIRIPYLVQLLGWVTFVSFEPLLGGIVLADALAPHGIYTEYKKPFDMAIVGGESGVFARPMDPDHARSLLYQCRAFDISFFFKQFGEWIEAIPDKTWKYNYRHHPHFGSMWRDGKAYIKVGKKVAGHLLDGVEYLEYPE